MPVVHRVGQPRPAGAGQLPLDHAAHHRRGRTAQADLAADRLSQADVLAALRGDYADFLAALVASPYVRQVTADPAAGSPPRRDRRGALTTTGTPVGHGFTESNRADGTAYYTFDRGLLRFVVLDTVNPNGEADGSLDADPVRLAGASSGRRPAEWSWSPVTTPLSSMDNPLVGTGGPRQRRRATGSRRRGEGAAALPPRRSSPRSAVTHRNQVWARRTRTAPAASGRSTPPLTSTGRSSPGCIEVTDNRDGTLWIFATMLDHSGPVAYGGRTADPLVLAGLARELAANDWQQRTPTCAATSRTATSSCSSRPPPRCCARQARRDLSRLSSERQRDAGTCVLASMSLEASPQQLVRQVGERAGRGQLLADPGLGVVARVRRLMPPAADLHLALESSSTASTWVTLSSIIPPISRWGGAARGVRDASSLLLAASPGKLWLGGGGGAAGAVDLAAAGVAHGRRDALGLDGRTNSRSSRRGATRSTSSRESG